MDQTEYRNDLKIHYWEKYKKTPIDSPERWQDYIEKFLPHELALACTREPPRLPSTSREALIMLAGHSLEPLLQSVCAWKPTKKILLLLNDFYGTNLRGGDWGSFVADLIIQLFEKNPKLKALAKTPEIVCTVLKSHKPEEVFRQVRKEVIDLVKDYTHKQVVLDITGGKKSMVAGAYLLGAYADIDISYVDFDDDAYEPEFNRPYGDACYIQILENPYKLFGLREWQQAERLYEQYAFRNARELVENLRRNTEQFFTDGEKQAAEKLMEALKIYELWENADYTGALKDYVVSQSKPTPIKASATNQNNNAPKPNQPQFVMPTAVQELSDWPHAEKEKSAGDAGAQLLRQITKLQTGREQQGQVDLPKSLYLTTDNLLIYARDELAKIYRLIKRNEDYRSALLRAASLHEVLCRSRLFILKRLRRITKNPPLRSEQDVFNFFTRLGMWQTNTILKSVNASLQEKSYTLNRSDPAGTPPLIIEEWIADGFKMADLPDLRNNAIHFCLSVTKKLAQAAFRIAKMNFDNFRDFWAEHGVQTKTAIAFDVSAVSWETLCRECGIDFLPPARKS
ncbi:hypothetical protein HUU39_05725 [candidate division KSB1 bacterium]|nr:hypothetical protein [bacterium]NUM64760.1 hypothetical protein [candidate division KSB1 bacterium]